MLQRPMLPLLLFMVPLVLKIQVERCFWVYVAATVLSYGHFVSGVSLEISSFLKVKKSVLKLIFCKDSNFYHSKFVMLK
jgi:hypothetical protein